jgi:molybdopterin-guanine dinucleotide biosynthesis protein A
MSEPTSRFATVSAAILVGCRAEVGASRLAVAGVANTTRIANRLVRLFEDVMLVGADSPPEAPGRRVADVAGPECALRGVVSALEAARTERVLVVACDLPLISSELLLALVAWPEADLVLPRTRDGLQPACALFRRDAVLPIARTRLADGRLALRALAEVLETSEIGPDDVARIDPLGSALTPVDTPARLERAEALLSDPE